MSSAVPLATRSVTDRRQCRVSAPGALAVLALITAGPVAPAPAFAQQVGEAFDYSVESPTHDPDTGPVVAVDEGHHNFHTVDGRYRAFADLLRRDGYRVRAHEGAVSALSLAEVDVLVVANALSEEDDGDWALPSPSAFRRDEIKTLRRWVRAGGALLLIADHMPFPGAAEKLARAFDVRFLNGYVRVPGSPGPLIFDSGSGLQEGHAIIAGRTGGRQVASVATFTGSAFRSRHPGFRPLLVLPAGAESWQTRRAGEFPESTPRRSVAGWWQGAVRAVGRGRLAVFGEAAMFTAQRVGPEGRPMGMNAPVARDNPRLLLNLMDWLAAGPRPPTRPASPR